MARAMMITAVMLFASMVHCSAVRPEPAATAGSWASAVSATSLKDLTLELVGKANHHHHHHHNHDHVPFTLLTKYIIRPSIAKEFVEGWLKFHEVVQKAKGSKTINLSKPLTDNLLFYGYEEWHSKRDFLEFAKNSSAAKDLVEYIKEHDIPVVFTQLVPAVPYNKPDHASVSDVASQVAGMSMHALSQLINDAQDQYLPKARVSEEEEESLATHHHDDTRNNTVILLTKFLVKPSRIEEFVKAADLVTKAVAKHEKGNLVYGLSKPIDDDVSFYSYAIWEDKAALKHHLESCYTKKFLEYILDRDIYIKTTRLVPIEQLDE